MAGRTNLVFFISVDVLFSTLVVEISATNSGLFDFLAVSGFGFLALGGAGAMLRSPGTLISSNFLRFVGISRNCPVRIFFCGPSPFQFESADTETSYKLAIVVAFSPICTLCLTGSKPSVALEPVTCLSSSSLTLTTIGLRGVVALLIVIISRGKATISPFRKTASGVIPL